MALTLKQIVVLQTWLEDRVKEIKEAVDKNFKATGKTRDSITSRVEGDSGIIEGSSILHFGEFGRAATSESKKGRLYGIILEWIRIKGIKPRSADMSEKTLAFLIARKIDNEGIKVPNNYNRGEILSSVINPESVQELVEEFGELLVGEFESELLPILSVQ